MKVFGLTILAKDTVGLHYINHTVAAMSLAEADNIVLKYYQMIQDEFIEFDQAVELEINYSGSKSQILETQGKIYFQEE